MSPAHNLADSSQPQSNGLAPTQSHNQVATQLVSPSFANKPRSEKVPNRLETEEALSIEARAKYPEFRSQMSTIQRVNYIHMRFVENGCVSNQKFKSECAAEINLKDWGVRKNAEVLNANDNLFQLAFRRDPEWSYIRQIFGKWELGEIKGQKREKATKKPTKERGNGDAKLPVEDMKLTEWKLMQSIKDPEIIIPILKKVLEGEISLHEMGLEFIRQRTRLKVQKAFLALLHEKSWTDCKAKYPQHCNDNFLDNFVPAFTNWKDTTLKRKGGASDESDLRCYPDNFNAHILQAQNWLRMKTTSTIGSDNIPDALKCITFKHPEHGDVFYEIYNKDACKLHEFVSKRPYTLMVADIPRGFDLPTCLHEDGIPWAEQQITAMVQSFKMVTTAKNWRIVIMHSGDQYALVKSVLKRECNGETQDCIWIKDNVKNSGGAILDNNFELFEIGLHSQDGGRCREHCNFGVGESRSNVVNASAVTCKLKHSDDNQIVNVYQKPQALLDWVVHHFSYPGDWVLDLCAGSGTALASALSLGRHCLAVEKDERQCSVLKDRVLSLDVNVAGDPCL